MTPELRHLRYFVAVAEQRSFTRAAQLLTITQQSLSHQVNALERMLGVRLFDRDTRGTRLTGVGEVFLPEAKAVLERSEQALATIERAARGEVGRLAVVFLSSTANSLLPPIVRAFRERFPDVELVAEDTSIAQLVSGLREGRYDAGFTRPPLVDDLAGLTVLTERVCAVLPEEHRLATCAELTLADLADEPWVLTERSSWPPWHDSFARTFQQAGFEPDVVQRARSVQNLLGLVAAGVGVTRLTESAQTLRRTGVTFVPLTGETASTDLVWPPTAGNPALDNLRTLVAELAATTDLTRNG